MTHGGQVRLFGWSPVSGISALNVLKVTLMNTAVKKAVEALELLPEDMQESAADYLLWQAKKFRALKDAIDEGLADVEAGRVVPWDLQEFLKLAREQQRR